MPAVRSIGGLAVSRFRTIRCITNALNKYINGSCETLPARAHAGLFRNADQERPLIAKVHQRTAAVAAQRMFVGTDHAPELLEAGNNVLSDNYISPSRTIRPPHS